MAEDERKTESARRGLGRHPGCAAARPPNRVDLLVSLTAVSHLVESADFRGYAASRPYLLAPRETSSSQKLRLDRGEIPRFNHQASTDLTPSVFAGRMTGSSSVASTELFDGFRDR